MARLFKKANEDKEEEDFPEYEEQKRPVGRPSKEREQLPEMPTPPKEQVEVLEREINLSLINEKLNYLIGLVTKGLQN